MASTMHFTGYAKSAHSAKARILRPARQISLTRRCRCVVARAEKETKDSKNADKNEGDKSVKKAIDALRKDGIDSNVARKVLKAWQDDQVEDGKALRKQVFGVGVSVVALASVQLAVDIVGSYCANQTAVFVGTSGAFGSGVGAIALQTLSIYFAINAGLDMFRLGSVIGGTLVTGARSESLYQAIEELAGETSSITLLDKAQAAVSTSKVALALNSVRKAMQDEISSEKGLKFGSLSTLTALFVLQHAREKYDWTPEKAGITEGQAAEAAAMFGKFDRNEDNKLEWSEFRALCSAANFSLSDEESKKAVEMLDKRESGYVEFDEFASWWMSKEGADISAITEKKEKAAAA